MSAARLKDLEKKLERLRRQKSGIEDALGTIEQSQKERIRQQIEEVCELMRPFEEEYWQILAEQSSELDISEAEAEVAVTELVTEIEQIETRQQYEAEVLEALLAIQTQLQQPGPSAAGKLKGTLSSFPPFIGLSYEAEIDTENFFRRHFPTFRRVLKAAAKKS